VVTLVAGRLAPHAERRCLGIRTSLLQRREDAGRDLVTSSGTVLPSGAKLTKGWKNR
jgi:hypothetical protein